MQFQVAETDHGLIPLRKRDLKDILQKNRSEHRKVFEEALEGYREEVISTLNERLEDAKKGKRINLAIGLIEPMDQTREYDRALRMLDLSIGEEVYLTEQEFAQLIMDDWQWKHQFEVSTSNYLVSNRRSKR